MKILPQLLFLLVIASVQAWASVRNTPLTSCGCDDDSLCKPIQRAQPEKEVLGYAVDSTGDHAPLYNWTLLTTMAYYGGANGAGEPFNWTTYCTAKKHGVKIALAAGNTPAPEQLKNETVWKASVDDTVARAVNYGWDGIHWDWELFYELHGNTTLINTLKDVVRYMGKKLKAEGLQFSAAVGTAASEPTNPMDLEYCDFLMIMDYDQSWAGPGPNAPYGGAVASIDNYMALSKNQSSKLILGEPWYGHYYPCTNEYAGAETVCESKIDKGELPYSYINQMLRGEPLPVNYTVLNNTVNLTKGTAGSFARLDYVDHATTAQFPWWVIYYDTPETLTQKYQLAKDRNLRGVSMWNIDSVSYARTAHGAKERAEMWAAIATFL